MPKKHELPLIRYLVLFEGTVSGPFTLAQLQALWRKGEFDPASSVAKEGEESNWRPILDMKATLDPSVQRTAARTTTEEGQRRRRRKGANQTQDNVTKRMETMTSVLLVGGLVLALLGVALLTYLVGRVL